MLDFVGKGSAHTLRWCHSTRFSASRYARLDRLGAASFDAGSGYGHDGQVERQSVLHSDIQPGRSQSTRHLRHETRSARRDSRPFQAHLDQSRRPADLRDPAAHRSHRRQDRVSAILLPSRRGGTRCRLADHANRSLVLGWYQHAARWFCSLVFARPAR